MEKPVQLKFRKLDVNAVLPKKTYDTDAAFDLFMPDNHGIILLQPQVPVLFNTGISCIIPKGYWLKFHERSGLAFKYNIKVSGGVIDSCYTGELKVILVNLSHNIETIACGKAICQFTLEKVLPCEVSWISEEEFEKEVELRSRKDNGFGSSDEISTK